MAIHDQDTSPLQARERRFSKSRLCRLPQKRRKTEGTAVSRGRLDLELPSHVGHQVPGDRQSETCAAVYTSSRAITLGEGIQNPLPRLRAHTNACVAYFKLQGHGGLKRCRQRYVHDDLALLGKLDGIAQEIHEDLA